MQINQIDRGLESLSIFPKEPHRKRQESDCRRGTAATAAVDSLFSSSPSPSSLFGDSIGMESSVDILKDDDHCRHYSDEELHRSRRRERRFSAEAAARREFPPPIPSLARTENLQSRMAWVLRRHYTGDGRLILTEEKARRHEFFRARRCDGRLTLHLVPLDDVAEADVDDGHSGEVDDRDHDHDHDRDRERDCDRGDDEMDGGDHEGVKSLRAYSSEVSRRSGSRCVVNGVAVPAAIRPVHS